MVENVTQIKSGITECKRERKNPGKHLVCRKDYIWNPSACIFNNEKEVLLVFQ